jgi:hypothetical protein
VPDQSRLRIILEAAGVHGDELGADDVRRIWATFGVDDEDLLDEFEYAVASISGQDAGGSEDVGFRVGRWRLDLSKEGVRAALLGVIVAAALAAQGIGAIGIGLATVVVPTVLSLEDVTLSSGDNRLLFQLRLHPGVEGQHLTEDELYATLPPEVRDVVNPFDFANFVDRLRKAGMAEQAGGNSTHSRPVHLLPHTPAIPLASSPTACRPLSSWKIRDIRACRASWPSLEGGTGMDEDFTILEVAVGEGTTLQVVALDYGGAQDVAALGPVSLDRVIDTIKDLAGSIKSAIETIAPERASVEFGVQVAVKAGKLSALLVEGSGQAFRKVALGWGT